jgi:hypothetical protein
MAINKNHEFEELDGVKCGIVEKNVKPERVSFLKSLLEYNGFTVVVVPTPAPKVIPPSSGTPKPAEGATEPVKPVEPLPTPETYTVGVTDYTFNSINAIFGRLLHTPNKQVVTLAYWQQKEKVIDDEVPYYEN